MPVSVTNREQDFRGIPAPERDSDLVRRAVTLLRERLPGSWEMQVDEQPEAPDRGLDAIVRVASPDGQQIALVIEAKRLLSTRDVPIVLERLQFALASAGRDEPAIPLIVARYLAPATRQRIAAAGAGYIDATGNMQIRGDRPALFVADRGADRDPWRGRGRPRDSLAGGPAARVVRALIDFAPPYSVPELVERSGASTGTAYRVVELLENEDLLTRQAYGPISDVRWRPVLMRWSEDYGLAQSNPVTTYLEPRGLQALTKRLRAVGDLAYVLTGSLAAERLVAYAPARLAMLYVDDPDRAVETLGLRETTSGANVVLAAAKDSFVFDRSETADDLRVAAASQVAVDLLSGPGRNPSEATALLDWMEANEPAWRR
jgi:hypothetical protein